MNNQQVHRVSRKRDDPRERTEVGEKLCIYQQLNLD